MDSQSVLCGQFVGFSDLSYTGNIKILAVVFHTYAANAFFRIPVSEFCDRKVTAGEAGDRDLLELEDRLLYEAEDRNCIRLVEQFLLRRLNPLKSYNLERMRSVISTIDREKGEIRVSDLASSVFLAPSVSACVYRAYRDQSQRFPAHSPFPVCICICCSLFRA